MSIDTEATPFLKLKDYEDQVRSQSFRNLEDDQIRSRIRLIRETDGASTEAKLRAKRARQEIIESCLSIFPFAVRRTRAYIGWENHIAEFYFRLNACIDNYSIDSAVRFAAYL